MKTSSRLLRLSSLLLLVSFLIFLWPVLTEYGYVFRYGSFAFLDWVGATFSNNAGMGILAMLVLLKDWLFPWLALLGALAGLIWRQRWAVITGASLIVSTFLIQLMAAHFLAGLSLDRVVQGLAPATLMQVAQYLGLCLALVSIILGAIAENSSKLASSKTASAPQSQAGESIEIKPVGYDTQTGRPILRYDSRTGKPIYADEKPQG